MTPRCRAPQTTYTAVPGLRYRSAAVRRAIQTTACSAAVGSALAGSALPDARIGLARCTRTHAHSRIALACVHGHGSHHRRPHQCRPHHRWSHHRWSHHRRPHHRRPHHRRPHHRSPRDHRCAHRDRPHEPSTARFVESTVECDCPLLKVILPTRALALGEHHSDGCMMRVRFCARKTHYLKLADGGTLGRVSPATVHSRSRTLPRAGLFESWWSLDNQLLNGAAGVD